jgi:hypothetical protein
MPRHDRKLHATLDQHLWICMQLNSSITPSHRLCGASSVAPTGKTRHPAAVLAHAIDKDRSCPVIASPAPGGVHLDRVEKTERGLMVDLLAV